jgi:hypothetical protein
MTTKGNKYNDMDDSAAVADTVITPKASQFKFH